MRAISPHAEYSIVVKPGVTKLIVDSTGVTREVDEESHLILYFEHFATTPEESAAALQAFSFSGLAEGVNPLTTLGVWDSEIYQRTHQLKDDEMKAICAALRAKGESQGWNRFIIVDEPMAPKPWPSYDEEEDVEEIVALAERLSLTDAVIQYERENQNREAILTALGIAPPEPAIEVSV